MLSSPGLAALVVNVTSSPAACAALTADVLLLMPGAAVVAAPLESPRGPPPCWICTWPVDSHARIISRSATARSVDTAASRITLRWLMMASNAPAPAAAIMLVIANPITSSINVIPRRARSIIGASPGRA